jgi:Vacuolar-sorting-associated 13 protein C-terminal
MLVVGVSFAPRHSSGVVVRDSVVFERMLTLLRLLKSSQCQCLRSVTVAPRNLSINVDLAFLVRLQKYLLDMQAHFRDLRFPEASSDWLPPDVAELCKSLDEASASPEGRQKFFFGGLTIMPCNIKLSVAPARALTSAQAALEGEVAAALHLAVRKGDVKLGDIKIALLGVRVGHTNSTPLAVVRGVFKSIVVDALLRLDGAKLNFAGVSLRNHTSTSSQLSTHLGAHYFASLRQNLPALVGSLSAFGNPLGLVRGLGDGVRYVVRRALGGEVSR